MQDKPAEKISKKENQTESQDVKKPRHATRYLFVGIGISVFNYISYTILTNIIIKNNDLIWLSTLISTTITAIIAFIAHSKITWKERPITKTSIYKFFIWNALLAFFIGPGISQFFSLFTPLYQFAFNIVLALHIPFTYEFVLTTGVFLLTAIVGMILNFLFYDRFVFGKKVMLK